MSKREEIRKRRQQKQKRQNLIVLGIVSVFAIAVVGIIVYQSLKPIGEIKTLEERNHPTPDGMALGDPNAPVVVEEFSDFQCVACFNFWDNQEADFIDTYVATGKVYFKYNAFNIFGAESDQAAKAAYCANEQDRFWDYHDMLFVNWNGENTGNYNAKRLEAFAENIGLNTSEFNQCYNSSKYNTEIQQSHQLGLQKGVNSTPSFIVNGQLVFSNDLVSTIEGLLGN
ncbi:MAG: hypothetical protein CVU39_06405 [Chloroflexi bacterium HGW-Chloroflexi-10]|nr:MAG: hypothetical protein CVU39_06405 [Chloroflexi bacterium HGW-Chloroflexi-10]